MQSYNIREQLLTYLKSINLTVSQLEDLCGFSRRYFNNVRFKVPASRIDTVLRVLPDLNREWLLNGKGSMTDNLPSYTHVTPADNTPTNNIRFYNRAVVLLENVGMTIQEFEASHGIDIGGIRKLFESGDQKNMDRIALLMLREYPKFSFDWLFSGKGQALKNRQMCIPVVKYPSWLYHQAAILTEARVDDKKHERELLQVTRYFSNLARITIDPSIIEKDVSFALEMVSDSLFPYAPFGSILLCQHKCSLFGDRWDYEALYVVEKKVDKKPDEYSPEKLVFGFLEEREKGILVKPVRNSIAAGSMPSQVFIGCDQLDTVAKVVGVIHKTFFPGAS